MSLERITTPAPATLRSEVPGSLAVRQPSPWQCERPRPADAHVRDTAFMIENRFSLSASGLLTSVLTVFALGVCGLLGARLNESWGGLQTARHNAQLVVADRDLYHAAQSIRAVRGMIQAVLQDQE